MCGQKCHQPAFCYYAVFLTMMDCILLEPKPNWTLFSLSCSWTFNHSHRKRTNIVPVFANCGGNYRYFRLWCHLQSFHEISLGLDPALSTVVLSHSPVQEACKYLCLYMSTRETRNINYTSLSLQRKRCITCFLSQKLEMEVGNTSNHCHYPMFRPHRLPQTLIFISNNR